MFWNKLGGLVMQLTVLINRKHEMFWNNIYL